MRGKSGDRLLVKEGASAKNIELGGGRVLAKEEKSHGVEKISTERGEKKARKKKKDGKALS